MLSKKVDYCRARWPPKCKKSLEGLQVYGAGIMPGGRLSPEGEMARKCVTKYAATSLSPCIHTPFEDDGIVCKYNYKVTMATTRKPKT
eukprot:2435429-Pleurochrysis_carterae.AAC.1